MRRDQTKRREFQGNRQLLLPMRQRRKFPNNHRLLKQRLDHQAASEWEMDYRASSEDTALQRYRTGITEAQLRDAPTFTDYCQRALISTLTRPHNGVALPRTSGPGALKRKRLTKRLIFLQRELHKVDVLNVIFGFAGGQQGV